MSLEEKNKEKRKTQSLTLEERLTFFFFPFTYWQRNIFGTYKGPTSDEMERFERHGFERKIRQAGWMQFLGWIFYAIVIISATHWLKSQ